MLRLFVQLYSMISQRDSRINLTVAHDSKTIAAAAMRDSKAMRTVAVLTLVFLPATLIAVCSRLTVSRSLFHSRGFADEDRVSSAQEYSTSVMQTASKTTVSSPVYGGCLYLYVSCSQVPFSQRGHYIPDTGQKTKIPRSNERFALTPGSVVKEIALNNRTSRPYFHRVHNQT